MGILNEADRVWNRACLERGGLMPREGDVAQAAMLLVHGLVMNGGVLHAMEAVSKEELLAAAEGYRFFGFGQLADLLEEARANIEGDIISDDMELKLNNAYAAIVPRDGVLVDAFERHFAAHRSMYARVADA